ncbi:MAG: glycosyltransferase [Spirochaetes bacterium]|jgi:glycosyltransferase involved in cell wall biosynthesis|nr:glycosyltransferase [Spirochaetota bacterium]
MDRDAPHICMIAYTTYSGDGRIRREAETLVAAGGYRVSIIVPRERGRRRPYLLSGVRVIERGKAQYQGNSTVTYLARYAAFLLYASLACLRLFLLGSARLIHVHNMPNALVLAAFVPRLLGARVVLDIHDTMVETFASKYDAMPQALARALRMEERLGCLLADAVVAVNEIQKQVITARSVAPSKIRILMNVPDHRRFSGACARTPGTADHQACRLVYHGTLSYRLGVDLIIEAVALLQKDIPTIEAIIIGIGDSTDALKRLSTRLGVASRVAFYGLVPVDRIPDVLCDMTIGVVPNRRSPATELMLPVKMMEYFALGIPVVAPSLRTIEHYVPPEAIAEFEPGSASSLAASLARLWEDAERRRQQADRGLEFIAGYGWHKHSHDLLDMYTELSAQRNGHEHLELRPGRLR